MPHPYIALVGAILTAAWFALLFGLLDASMDEDGEGAR